MLKDSRKLSVLEIQSALRDEIKDTKILLYSSIGSTNEEAMKKIEVGELQEWNIVVAEEQTAGKGRRGKSFESPAQSGLYMTIVISAGNKVDLSKGQDLGVSLITVKAAVATCRAIEKINGGNTKKIKWVNDLYWNGKKICGILSESSIDAGTEGVASIIVGIGINVTTALEEFSDEVGKIAGSLDVHDMNRNQLCAEVVNQLYMLVVEKKDSEILEEYKSRSLVLGKEISFPIGEEMHWGMATDINEKGNLVVNEKGRTIVLNSGEISIRGNWNEEKK